MFSPFVFIEPYHTSLSSTEQVSHKLCVGCCGAGATIGYLGGGLKFFPGHIYLLVFHKGD